MQYTASKQDNYNYHLITETDTNMKSDIYITSKCGPVKMPVLCFLHSMRVPSINRHCT